MNLEMDGIPMALKQKHLNALKSISLAGLLCLLIVGCGSSVNTVPAGGILKINGKPVTGAVATVKFYPASGGRSAMAHVKEDGTFQISYLKPGDGLPPGSYKVAVTAAINKTKADLTEEEEFAGTGVRSKFLVPQEYSSTQTTPLTYEIPDNGKEQFIEIDVVLEK